MIKKSKTNPLRVVLHGGYQFLTKEEIDGHAEFENIIETSFADFNGIMLRNHYIGHSDPAMFKDWTKKMLETHDMGVLDYKVET